MQCVPGTSSEAVYGIADFGLPGTPDSFLSANAIADKVATDSNWTFLGTAECQQKLDQAQGYANLNKAVIAVYKSSGHGHVCLILPGKMQLSSTWNTLVPNSASFPLDDPTHAYVGGPLSKAFGVDSEGDVKFLRTKLLTGSGGNFWRTQRWNDPGRRNS